MILSIWCQMHVEHSCQMHVQQRKSPEPLRPISVKLGANQLWILYKLRTMPLYKG